MIPLEEPASEGEVVSRVDEYFSKKSDAVPGGSTSQGPSLTVVD